MGVNNKREAVELANCINARGPNSGLAIFGVP